MMKIRAIAFGALFCACSAFGSGFQVLEQGASNLGSALAGSTANANSDASAAFWNPSATFFSGLKVGELKVDSGISFVISSFRFYNDGSTNPMGGTGTDGGNAGQLAYIPNFFVTYRPLEDWAVSLSVTSTYGLETNYQNNWIGRFQGIKSDMMTIDINPSVAYRATDWLSFHAGASAQWMHAILTQATMLAPGYEGHVRMNGEDWSAGANAGFTVKYCETGRIGFSWRSEVSQKLNGNMRVNDVITNPINADVCLPQSFTVGIYQRLWGVMKDFAVMADYSYTCWDSFDVLEIKNSNTGQTVGQPTQENWRNVSRVSVGMHYYVDDSWTLRLGLAYDESPIKSVYDRTVRIPCSDRYWIAGGVGYKYENFHVDLSYMYIMFPNDSPINKTDASGTIRGNMEGRAHVVSLQVGISF